MNCREPLPRLEFESLGPNPTTITVMQWSPLVDDQQCVDLLKVTDKHKNTKITNVDRSLRLSSWNESQSNWILSKWKEFFTYVKERISLLPTWKAVLSLNMAKYAAHSNWHRLNELRRGSIIKVLCWKTNKTKLKERNKHTIKLQW